MDFKLEICCADLHSIRAAIAGGANRVELCQALDVDGLTPSAGMIGMAVNSGIDVHVLIRPRAGDFIYTEDEVDCMIYDIQIARKLGAQGVVIGALTPEGGYRHTGLPSYGRGCRREDAHYLSSRLRCMS